MLACAHGRGVCLWQRISANESPARHALLSSQGAGTDWLPAFLRWPSSAPATSVAWHPSGSLLAACSVSDGWLYVWDSRQVHSAPQRCALAHGGGAHVLRWSPCGQLLFCGARPTFILVACSDVNASHRQEHFCMACCTPGLSYDWRLVLPFWTRAACSACACCHPAGRLCRLCTRAVSGL